jgi:protease-4
VLAGLDPEADVRIVSYPGSSLLELLRPKPSSQPAAASLPEAVAALLGSSIVGVVEQAQNAFGGAMALYLAPKVEP